MSMIYKAEVTLYLRVPDDCADPESYVADSLSAQLSEGGNEDSQIADWHYRLAPGVPSGYVYPVKATREDLAETELLGGLDDPDYDPTPYETGEPDNLPREAQERAQEDLKFKR